MPIYTRKIENSPLEEKETKIEVEGDYLTHLNIKFPAGCYGLMNVAIFYGDEQVFPREKGTYFNGDDETIMWDGLWELPEHPCPLTVYTYNEDDTYNHLILLRLTTKYAYELPDYRIVKALGMQHGRITAFLSKLFGR